jgi:hypothetical protein
MNILFGVLLTFRAFPFPVDFAMFWKDSEGKYCHHSEFFRSGLQSAMWSIQSKIFFRIKKFGFFSGLALYSLKVLFGDEDKAINRNDWYGYCHDYSYWCQEPRVHRWMLGLSRGTFDMTGLLGNLRQSGEHHWFLGDDGAAKYLPNQSPIEQLTWVG